MQTQRNRGLKNPLVDMVDLTPPQFGFTKHGEAPIEWIKTITSDQADEPQTVTITLNQWVTPEDFYTLTFRHAQLEAPFVVAFDTLNEALIASVSEAFWVAGVWLMAENMKDTFDPTELFDHLMLYDPKRFEQQIVKNDLSTDNAATLAISALNGRILKDVQPDTMEATA
ncbi:hypothetical protein [Marinobacter salarius]|uniref:Uncharacterized protein n=1 Tax=Marinobacter salarius TaxID=1420917 RepID=A0A1W6KFG7_9GAMM|nr:hypothetical protein [Marinobacter salarius]ARM86168.1 hypothetical protein MARSALSMR5_04148 [Marinobacter salarius]